MPYFSEDVGEAINDAFGNAECFLLGRRTYEIFAASWPNHPDKDDPIFAQSDADTVATTWDQVRDELGERFPEIATLMDDAKPEVLAFNGFPRAHWTKVWSTNPLELFNKEVKRRARVVGIFLRVSLVSGEELEVTRSPSVEPCALTSLGPVPPAPSGWSSELIATCIDRTAGS